MPYKTFGPKKAGFKGGKSFGSKPAFGAKKRFGGPSKSSFGAGPKKVWPSRPSAGAGYGRPSAGGYADRGPKPEAHDAVCDVCGKACRVPFKPNGSKPVLCTNCFKKDRGAESTYSGRRSAGHEEGIPGAFGNRLKNKYSPPTAAASSYGATNKLEKRLDTIEAKLDMILKKLGASGAKAALGEDEFSL
jgi:CxxC-x17-CxxC domain-containing protein